MVDFDTNAALLKKVGIKVAAGSIDSAEQTRSLAQGLYIGAVQMFGGLDLHAVHAATGANYLVTERRSMLHATGFLLNPEGTIETTVYSDGPIGRFTANDIVKKVLFEQARREKS